MLKNLNILLWCGLCAVMLVASCKKDETPSFTEDDLTIDGGWTFTARETNIDEDIDAIVAGISDEDIDANGTTRTEVKQFLLFSAVLIESVEPCEANESIVFETSGTITINDDMTCDGLEAFDPTISNTWTLDGNTLTTKSGSETVVYQVIRLTENELVIETVSDSDTEILFGLTSTAQVRIKFFFAANR